MDISEIIKEEISKATIEKPVTSTQLIKLVRAKLNQTINSRKVRLIVKELQKEGLAVAGLKTDKRGYFIVKSLDELKRYEREVDNYWQKVKQTRDLVENSPS